MSYPVRCRRCGAPFIPDRPAMRFGPWRLCSRYRGPRPPVGSIPALNGGTPDPFPPGVAS